MRYERDVSNQKFINMSCVDWPKEMEKIATTDAAYGTYRADVAVEGTVGNLHCLELPRGLAASRRSPGGINVQVLAMRAGSSSQGTHSSSSVDSRGRGGGGGA